MDDIVLRGMAKWPNVPAVYGWLALDRRGNWLLNGQQISNPTVVAFIGRNYSSDDAGRWFFQNGPQRVYVALQYTPRVYRMLDAGESGVAIQASTGTPATLIRGAWMDEEGALLIETELGIGVVHDRDLDAMSGALTASDGRRPSEDDLLQYIEALQQGRAAPLYLKAYGTLVHVQPIKGSEVRARFRFIPNPTETISSVPQDDAAS